MATAVQPFDVSNTWKWFDIDLATFQQVASQTPRSVEREMKKVLGAIWFDYNKKLEELITTQETTLTNRIKALKKEQAATSDPDESREYEELIRKLSQRLSMCRMVLTKSADSGKIESLNAFHNDAKLLGLVLCANKNESQYLSMRSITSWIGKRECGVFGAWNNVNGKHLVHLCAPWV
jgi:hypothetical protein